MFYCHFLSCKCLQKLQTDGKNKLNESPFAHYTLAFGEAAGSVMEKAYQVWGTSTFYATFKSIYFHVMKRSISFFFFYKRNCFLWCSITIKSSPGFCPAAQVTVKTFSSKNDKMFSLKLRFLSEQLLFWM